MTWKPSWFYLRCVIPLLAISATGIYPDIARRDVPIGLVLAALFLWHLTVMAMLGQTDIVDIGSFLPLAYAIILIAERRSARIGPEGALVVTAACYLLYAWLSFVGLRRSAREENRRRTSLKPGRIAAIATLSVVGGALCVVGGTETVGLLLLPALVVFPVILCVALFFPGTALEGEQRNGDSDRDELS